MNSQMRRIDLICKLLGPFFIALINGISIETAIIVNLGLNCVSVVIEYFSIAEVRRTFRSHVLIPLIADPFRFIIEYPSCRNLNQPSLEFNTKM